jgi:hypothetical protein
MKLCFQWTKNKVNRRFLQVDMAELPKVARSEIFWTACKSGNKMAIAPSFGLWLRWMSTCWKGNFIEFWMEQYLVYVLLCTQGKIHEKEAAATRWEQDSGDEDDDNKEELGQRFHWITRYEIQKFGTKTKTPRALEKEGTSWQHSTLGDVRSKSPWITHKCWHPMARILWALTRRIMELHEDIGDMCEVPQIIRRVSPHKATLMMCGTNEGIAKRRCKPPIIGDCLLSTPRDHSR